VSAAVFQERYGPCALIAGGSDGIGAAFAEELASQGFDLLLLARRAAVLADTAARLRDAHGVAVHTRSVDLRSADLVDEVSSVAAGLEIGLLVYNAGSATALGRFLDQEVAEAQRMVALNCSGPIALAHHCGRSMRARGRGGMIFLTSMAGLAGSSHQVAYSATKAFDHVFAEALWHDLHPAGIDVLSLVVGATRTPSVERIGLDFEKLRPGDPEAGAMLPREVAREGLAHLGLGPLWAAGEFNRGLLPFFFSPDRAAVVNALSRGVANIHGLDYVPVSKRSD
jgi:short-subunit dehydrogenase